MIFLYASFASTTSSISDSIGLFIGGLGVVGIAGGAVGYFAKARGDSIIEYQAKELDLRDQTNKRLELDNAALRQERDSLKEQNTTLTALAQGSPELIKLTSEIKKLVGVVLKQSRGRQQ